MKMVFSRITIAWKLIAEVFLLAIFVNLFMVLLVGTYFLGYWQGVVAGREETESRYIGFLPAWLKSLVAYRAEPKPTQTPTPTTPSQEETSLIKSVNWGGPELWEAVNKRRTELGVNALSKRDELCTIASIRLNDLLELGKLDGHKGFSNMAERRQDLAWIFEKYSNLAEFLMAGAETAQEAVSLWEDTLGHRKLLDGGEYVWGCIYAQNSFAVAITAF